MSEATSPTERPKRTQGPVGVAFRTNTFYGVKKGLKRPLLQDLKVRKVVTVAKIEKRELTIESRREPRSARPGAPLDIFVYLAGVKVGRYDRKGSGLPIWPIAELKVTLCDGRIFKVHNCDINVIERWEPCTEPWGKSSHKPVLKSVCSSYADLGDGWAITVEKALRLKVGKPVIVDRPFQWVGDVLSNGLFTFPRERPFGGDWWRYPFPAVDCWDDFLETLEGKCVSNVIEFRKGYLRHRKEERVRKRQVVLTERQECVQRVINKLLWKGGGCEQIALGRNIIFVVKHEGNPVLYVVDNPGVGAIYRFFGEKKARALASGAWRRLDAIEEGADRIVHQGNWEERLEAVVREVRGVAPAEADIPEGVIAA